MIFADFVIKPLAGVASCKKCKAVGTIVEMGKCCAVAKLVLRGPLWDISTRQLCRRTVKPHGPRKAHG